MLGIFGGARGLAAVTFDEVDSPMTARESRCFDVISVEVIVDVVIVDVISGGAQCDCSATLGFCNASRTNSLK